MKITIDIPRNDLDELAVDVIMSEIGKSLLYSKEDFTEQEDGSHRLLTSYGEIFFTEFY
jgi:uncharacterized protein YccT (UPF0319 family)